MGQLGDFEHGGYSLIKLGDRTEARSVAETHGNRNPVVLQAEISTLEQT